MRMNLDLGLVRRLSSLALLPSHMIEATFLEIRHSYQTNENRPIFTYFLQEWLKKVGLRNLMKQIKMTRNDLMR
jgi:phage gp16-like protein